MSDGKTHQRITLALVLPTAVTAYAISQDAATAVSAAVGCTFVVFVGCDLDQIGITKNEGQMLKRFGCLSLPVLMIFMPYAYFIPHRSPLSHFPIVGTLGRDLYIGAWAALAVYLLDSQLGWQTAVYLQALFVPEYALAFFAGQALADSAHYAADIVSTARKRHKPATRKR